MTLAISRVFMCIVMNQYVQIHPEFILSSQSLNVLRLYSYLKYRYALAPRDLMTVWLSEWMMAPVLVNILRISHLATSFIVIFKVIFTCRAFAAVIRAPLILTQAVLWTFVIILVMGYLLAAFQHTTTPCR